MLDISVLVVSLALLIMTIVFYYHQRIFVYPRFEGFADAPQAQLQALISEQVKQSLVDAKPNIQAMAREELDKFGERSVKAFDDLTKSIDNVAKSIEKIEKAMNKG